MGFDGVRTLMEPVHQLLLGCRLPIRYIRGGLWGQAGYGGSTKILSLVMCLDYLLPEKTYFVICPDA